MSFCGLSSFRANTAEILATIRADDYTFVQARAWASYPYFSYLCWSVFMVRRFCWLICGALVLVNSAWAVGPEWPQWRGPNRDGISSDTGLLKQWPANGPEVVWTTKGLGDGYSSIAIASGKIFTMGERGGNGYIICLDSQNGNELWATKIGGSADGGGYKGPRCVPAVDGDLVYGIGIDGSVACVAVVNGQLKWRKNFGEDFGGKMMSGWGFSESPLIDGDALLCTPGGKEAGIVALNKKTGAVIGKSVINIEGGAGKEGAGYSSIVISNAGGVKQYVTLMGKGVVGIRAKDGKQLWSYNRIANKTACIPTVIPHDDYIICSSGYADGGSALLKISKAGKDEVKMEEVWYHDAKTLQNHHGGMTLLGDYVYLGHGHNNGFPACFEWKTGKVLYNKERGPGSGSAAVGYADGLFYFRYQDGTMALLDMKPEGFKVLSTFKIPDVKKPSWPYPIIVGGKLYIREQDALYCYNVSASGGK